MKIITEIYTFVCRLAEENNDDLDDLIYYGFNIAWKETVF